jgi:imidazolonepropionase-like amidohydrolase
MRRRHGGEDDLLMQAIRASRVFDGERFLPGGATVLVEDDRIVGVEPGRFPPPADVPVTEVGGTLLPGLVDCHVHLVSTGALAGTPLSLEWAGTAQVTAVDEVVVGSLRAQVAAGVTTVRDLGDVGYRVLDHRDRADPTLPRIVASGPPVTSPDGHCHFLGGEVDPADPATIDRAVAERAERGVDLVKVMASGGFLTAGTVVAHTHSLAGAEVALEAGVDGLEHFTNMAEGHVGASDELLERVAAAGVTVDPTLGRDMSRFPPPEVVPAHVHAMLARVGVTDRDEHFAQLARDTGRLREHGIRVVSGLDAGAMPAKLHGNVWRGVVELVDGGWPVDAAVATATSVAAEDCGVPTGRLAPGLLADLLVVDGDLAADVGALSRPVAVWLGGVQLEP